MRLYDGGYSHTQYNLNELRAKAKEIAAALPHLMAKTGAQAVAVRGKSGLSLAFATMMIHDFPLIVVRKRGENSHGATIEGMSGVEVEKYLILDDFVASGQTVKDVVEELELYAEAQGSERPTCVGVVEYLRAGMYGHGYSRMHYVYVGRGDAEYNVQQYGTRPL